MHLPFRFCLAALCFGASLIVWIMAGSVAVRSQESAPAPSGTSGDARQRARALLAKMTVEEKAGQLNQAAGIRLPGVSEVGPDDAIRKGQVGSVLWVTGAEEINRLQRIAMEESRLRIPLLVGFDVIHGYRTAFPVPLAMASSWDPSVHEQAQRVAAKDARAAGVNWTFAPMVDIARDAPWPPRTVQTS
jgi:beta-glucosidase